MKPGRIYKLLFFCGLFLLIRCSEKHLTHFDHYICHVNVVDVEKGRIIPDQNIGIAGQKLVSVSSENVETDGLTNRIDGTGKFLIPGLWDMHVHYHWNAEVSNGLLIANGITGVREMFGDPAQIRSIREASGQNRLYAPEIVSSGPIVDGAPPVWPGSDTISTAAGAEALVQKQIKNGADFIKVYSLLNRESYFAIAAAAKKHKIDFAGHIPEGVSLWEAIAAGQKSIEHLDGLLDACTGYAGKKSAKHSFFDLQREKNILESFSEKKLDSLAQLLSKSETWLCPTLTVLQGIAWLDDTIRRNDPRMKLIPSWLYANWARFGKLGADYFSFAKKQFEFEQKLVGKLQKNGVKLLAGTDFPNPYCFPGFSLHDELVLMTEGGLSPAEALCAATLNPALYFGFEKQYGTIEQDKIASLVLLDKDPLTDIHNTQAICAVFLKGRYFGKEALKKMAKKY